MASFPNMIRFKQRQIPHPQLLRWAEWFSKYSFEVIHLKGKNNVLADFLSRPRKMEASRMFVKRRFIGPHRYETQDIQRTWVIFQYPPEVRTIIQEGRFQDLHGILQQYHQEVIDGYQGLLPQIVPDFDTRYPFIRPFRWDPRLPFPEDLKWFFWLLMHFYTIAFEFPTELLYQTIRRSMRNEFGHPSMKMFTQMLLWFQTIQSWDRFITTHNRIGRPEPERNTIVLLHRPWTFISSAGYGEVSDDPPRTGMSTFRPQQNLQTCIIAKTLSSRIATNHHEYRDLQHTLCQMNGQIPPQIWPMDPAIPVPWEQPPPVPPTDAPMIDSQDPFALDSPWNQYINPTPPNVESSSSAPPPLTAEQQYWWDIYQSNRDGNDSHQTEKTPSHASDTAPEDD